MLNIDKLAETSEMVMKLRLENDGLIDICASYKGPQVHLRHDALLESFDVYDVKKRGASSDYSYEIVTEHHGVIFFALMTQKEYEMEFEDSQEEKNAEEL